MKKIGFIFLVFLFLFNASVSFADSWNRWRSIDPDQYENKSTIYVSGNRRSYYPVTETEKVTLEISGPTRIRVLTRLAPPLEDSKEYNYSVFYEKDNDGKRHESKLKTEISDVSFLNNKKNVGQSRSIYIRIPRGEHTYEFSTKKETIYLRFFKREINRISYSPIDCANVVKLIYEERELDYYRATEDKPVTLDVIGDTKVKVIARLEYTPQMSGERSYRVEVRENGDVVKTYSLSTYKSEVTTYKKEKHLIPSKGETFFLEVPEGKHTYTFRGLESDSNVLFRFFIPERDVGNGM